MGVVTDSDPAGIGDVDLRDHIRPGDVIVWGQACAEPRTLTRRLLEIAPDIGGVTCFVGIPAESSLTIDTLGPPGGIDAVSYCGSGTNAGLHGAGRLRILPVHYSTLPDLLEQGSLRADVVLVQVAPPDDDGLHHLGIGEDYYAGAIDTARTVIAEINPNVPRTPGSRRIPGERFAAVVEATAPPPEMPTPKVDDLTRSVARNVAGLIEDEATLQFGIGALPEAVLAELVDRRDLGIHSGVFNDTAMDLVRRGVATGARKTNDRGVAIAGFLGGTSELFAWADRNPAIELRGTRYTHDHEILRTSHRLAAINAAIEVDLTGQVNAEVAAGRYVGAIGGAMDFLRGAARSPGGLPIVALPSASHGASRIVADLNGPVSTPRAEEIIVVTDRGVADLRGLTIEERIEAMLAIAHPDHRASLDVAAERVLGASTSLRGAS